MMPFLGIEIGSDFINLGVTFVNMTSRIIDPRFDYDIIIAK